MAGSVMNDQTMSRGAGCTNSKTYPASRSVTTTRLRSSSAAHAAPRSSTQPVTSPRPSYSSRYSVMPSAAGSTSIAAMHASLNIA